jgi:hypothetical protein
MTKNMGDDDRVIRLVSAFLLIVLYLQGIVKDPWSIILPIVAGLLIITAIVGFCPSYRLFRANTNQNK